MARGRVGFEAGGSDISSLGAYTCPHCGAPLQGWAAGAVVWLRCPGCGRAGRPPDGDARPEVPAAVDDVPVLGPRPMPPAGSGPPARATPGDARRVACASALFVSVTLLAFALHDRSPGGSAAFGAAAVGFLLLLLKAPRR